MTTIYFVRHAQPNYDNHDDLTRELSPKGLADRCLVTQLLADVVVDAVLSSPYHRSAATVEPLALQRGLPLRTVADFRERRIAGEWIADFTSFARAQWADFDYKLPEGESLREVQQRNVAALESVLAEFAGQTVVIGSHGTALSTIINRYAASFGFEDFQRIRSLMPWVVRLDFDGLRCRRILSIDPFSGTAQSLSVK